MRNPMDENARAEGDEDEDDLGWHLEPLGGLEELGELVLRHVHLARVHELQDRSQVLQMDLC